MDDRVWTPPTMAMSAPYNRVLVIERDARLRLALARALVQEGLEPRWAETGAEAESAMAAHQPCLVILNPRLGPDDGWAVYRRLRRHGVPVMLVATRSDGTIQRLALTLGADDCVVGPTDPGEIARRARFVLRRAPRPAPAPPSFGAVVLDPSRGAARVAGRLVSLTPSEYALLEALVEARGRVVPREQLVIRARARAGALPLTRSIDAHVRALRRKLGDHPEQPTLLLSVRGFGYRLAGSADSVPPSLARAVLDALPEPVVVVDEQQRVQLMNRAAEALVDRPADSAVGCLTCSALMGCAMSRLRSGTCPALVALGTGCSEQAAHVIRPRGTPLAVEESVSHVPDHSTYLVLRFRECHHD